ncbi:WD40 repeat domain-containing protein [Streptomyces violaceorubidus]
MSFDSGARTAFAERLALLYREAGNPPLKRVSEAVVRLQRVDERGRPVRVSAQRISDWRRAKNVPAQFPALAAVLHVLIPQARRARPVPVSAGLYDLAQWQLLWERAVADPTGERPAPTSAAEQPSAEGPAAPGGVCPYRGLAAYRRQDADWFFGRERSTRALVAQLHATRDTGGLIMLVGASGAGKSSLLNAGLVPALRTGTPDSGDDPPKAGAPVRAGGRSARRADPPGTAARTRRRRHKGSGGPGDGNPGAGLPRAPPHGRPAGGERREGSLRDLGGLRGTPGGGGGGGQDGRSEGAGRAGQEPGRAERPGRRGRSGRPGRPGRPTRPVRPVRPSRSERSERPERPERPGRPRTTERTGTA